MTNKVEQMLGLATCARKVATGETVLTKIRNNEASLVIIANDASDNTKKKLVDKCTFYNVEYRFFGDIDTISRATGKNNRVALAILDRGFSKKIKEIIGG